MLASLISIFLLGSTSSKVIEQKNEFYSTTLKQSTGFSNFYYSFSFNKGNYCSDKEYSWRLGTGTFQFTVFRESQTIAHQD